MAWKLQNRMRSVGQLRYPTEHNAAFYKMDLALATFKIIRLSLRAFPTRAQPISDSIPLVSATIQIADRGS